MKKKLLFYGSCHLSAVCRWMEENHSDKFEISDSKKAGIVPFWGERDKNFALWTQVNRPKQPEFKENVYKAIRDCDFFIFQPHEFNAVIPELKTSFLVKNVLNGVPVCLPNTRMTVYPIAPLTSLEDIINYAKTNISNKANEIIHYLKTEDDPELIEIINRHVKQQEVGNIRSRESFEHSVCMLDYIENNWQTKLLFCTQNHPTESYYQELVKRLFKVLGEESPLISDIQHPGSRQFINPLQFKFFQKICPNLEIPRNIPTQLFTEEYLIHNKLI